MFVVVCVVVLENPTQKKPQVIDPFADLRDDASSSNGANPPTTSLNNELAKYSFAHVCCTPVTAPVHEETVQRLSVTVTSCSSTAGNFCNLCTVEAQLFVCWENSDRGQSSSVSYLNSNDCVLSHNTKTKIICIFLE